MDETRRLWEAWSESFQAAWNAETDDGERRPAPIHYGPGFDEDDRFDPMPDLRDTDVVELGCGGGQASVGFAKEATDRVVGVDFAAEQLRHARSLRDEHGVDPAFVAGDVTALPLTADAFDLAFSSWVYQMVPSLEDAFAEAARVLRDDGTMVLAVPHPFYELFDVDERALERSYLDDAPERKSIGDHDPDLVVHHHTVADYHGALRAAGFVVDELREPGEDDPAIYREQWDHDPDLMALVPPTLVIRAVLE